MKGEKTSKIVQNVIVHYIPWESAACYKFIFHVNWLKKKKKRLNGAVIVTHINFKRISFFDYPLMLISRKNQFIYLFHSCIRNNLTAVKGFRLLASLTKHILYTEV